MFHNNSIEEINSGCLQRIADAIEKMATNYTFLHNELNMHKRMYADHIQEIEHLNKRISALKGVITKMKKQ